MKTVLYRTIVNEQFPNKKKKPVHPVSLFPSWFSLTLIFRLTLTTTFSLSSLIFTQTPHPQQLPTAPPPRTAPPRLATASPDHYSTMMTRSATTTVWTSTTTTSSIPVPTTVLPCSVSARTRSATKQVRPAAASAASLLSVLHQLSTSSACCTSRQPPPCAVLKLQALKKRGELFLKDFRKYWR